MFEFNVPAKYAAQWEGLKEVLRWLVLLVIAWFITEVLKQISLVPELYTLKFWVFSFGIPVRMILQTLLTLAGRYLDKVEYARTRSLKSVETKGFLPF